MSGDFVHLHLHSQYSLLDGASRMQAFWRVVFPLLRPATASVLIFLGVWIWNDFIDPLIILGPSQGTTITTGMTATTTITGTTDRAPSR